MLASLGSCKGMLVILRLDLFIGLTAVMLRWVWSSAQSAFQAQGILAVHELTGATQSRDRAVLILLGGSRGELILLGGIECWRAVLCSAIAVCS